MKCLMILAMSCFICFFSLESWGQNEDKSHAEEKNIFNLSKLDEFKSYVVDAVLCRNISRRWRPGEMEDVLEKREKILVYTDTVQKILPCTLHLELSGRGKIKNVVVSGIDEELLLDRIKYGVMSFPDNIFNREELKNSGITSVDVFLEIPLPGDYAVAESPKRLDRQKFFFMPSDIARQYGALATIVSRSDGGVLRGNIHYSVNSH